MGDIYKLELLSLVTKINQEIINHTGKFCGAYTYGFSSTK